MTREARPLFPADWPRYAVVIHVAFWALSALFLLACVGAFAGIVTAPVTITLIWLEIAAAGVLGASAIASGKLYHGNQVFSRTPMTGWAARVAGFVVLAASAFILLFAYALMHIRGG